MLETLVTIVTLAKMGEAHDGLLTANGLLIDMGGDFWPEVANIREPLLCRIKGSLAIVGVDPNQWPVVGRQAKACITWA